MSEGKTTHEPKNKHSAWFILAWLVGIFLLLGSLGLLITVPIAGIIMLIGAVIVLPPTDTIIRNKFNIKLSRGVKIVAVVIVMMFAFSSFAYYSGTSSGNIQAASTPLSQNTYISHELRTLHNIFFEGQLTDLQKKELWKEYEDKYVKWYGYVRQIDKAGVFESGDYVVLVNIDSPDRSFSGDASVFMDEDQGSALLRYSPGDAIYFEAKLVAYHDLLSYFELQDGIITNPPAPTKPNTTTYKPKAPVYKYDESGGYYKTPDCDGRQIIKDDIDGDRFTCDSQGMCGSDIVERPEYCEQNCEEAVGNATRWGYRLRSGICRCFIC